MFTITRIDIRRALGITTTHHPMQQCMFHGCSNVFPSNNESELCEAHEKLMKSRRPRRFR